jgi:hypothetical protein
MWHAFYKAPKAAALPAALMSRSAFQVRLKRGPSFQRCRKGENLRALE